MTEDSNEVEDEIEQTYEQPEHRSVGERTFLEGSVGGFDAHGERDGEYVGYGDYYVSADDVDALSDHDDSDRVQVETVSPLDTCEVCGDEFKSVEQHQTLSDCGDE